jgi:putative membrane protein
MTGRESSGKLGWMERRWVNKVADSGTTELNLAKLATEKASNPEVKSFAQKLVDDHTKVQDELKSLASQKNVELDVEDLGSDRAHKRLSKKSGMEFDQEFVEQMVDMHEADVKLFEKAASDGKDPALKSFAAKHVDHLRQHLQQAESLRSTIVPTGRMNDDNAAATSTDATNGASSTSATQPAYGTDSGSTGASSTSTSQPAYGSDASGSSSTSPRTGDSANSGTSDSTKRDGNP